MLARCEKTAAVGRRPRKLGGDRVRSGLREYRCNSARTATGRLLLAGVFSGITPSVQWLDAGDRSITVENSRIGH